MQPTLNDSCKSFNKTVAYLSGPGQICHFRPTNEHRVYILKLYTVVVFELAKTLVTIHLPLHEVIEPQQNRLIFCKFRQQTMDD